MEVFDETKQDRINELRQRRTHKIGEIASIKEIIRAKMEKGETDVNELYGAINRLEADINSLDVLLNTLKKGASYGSEDTDEQTAKAISLVAGGGGVNIRPRRNIPQVSSQDGTHSRR